MEAIYNNNTCYLCTKEHREVGREHRENTGNLILTRTWPPCTMITGAMLGTRFVEVCFYRSVMISIKLSETAQKNALASADVIVTQLLCYHMPLLYFVCNHLVYIFLQSDMYKFYLTKGYPPGAFTYMGKLWIHCYILEIRVERGTLLVCHKLQVKLCCLR